LLTALEKIKCFVFDVDGVLTNGTLIVMPNGVMVRTMNIKDGYAIQLAIKKGYKVWIISGGYSEEVQDRLEKLGVEEVHMKIKDKKQLLEMLYMGDDMPDFEAMQVVGIAACPADACFDIKNIASYKAIAKGGEGCAREVIEKVLKLNGHWDVVDHIQAK